MSTITKIFTRATAQLQAANIESAKLDASVLLGHVLNVSREQLLANPDKILNDNDISVFEGLVARRAHHEPIAYITGKKEFWSLDFSVTRDTLIPRPDSETLVEAALTRARNFAGQRQARPITLLDVGTGTGCLLIALLKELKSAQGVGVDNNERALQVAKENAKRHGIGARAEFKQSHWCDAIDGTFDLILSNPPYIAEGAMANLMADVLQYEPHGALVAGRDGLDAYRALVPQVAKRLAKGGYVLFEVGHTQAGAVEELLKAQGLRVEETEKDLAGVARCVAAQRTE